MSSHLQLFGVKLSLAFTFLANFATSVLAAVTRPNVFDTRSASRLLHYLMYRRNANGLLPGFSTESNSVPHALMMYGCVVRSSTLSRSRRGSRRGLVLHDEHLHRTCCITWAIGRVSSTTSPKWSVGCSWYGFLAAPFTEGIYFLKEKTARYPARTTKSGIVMYFDAKVFCTTEENRSRHAYDSVSFIARVALPGHVCIGYGPTTRPLASFRQLQ